MRELRTEKPWRNNEGPGFKSRQLHFLHFPWSLMTGGFALSVQVNAGVIDKGRLVVVSPYGAFLQIVNKKGRFQRAYLQKCTIHMITRGMITCDGMSYRHRDGANIIAFRYLSRP
ncbi:hypothetical protein N579_10465 [Corynebacterium pseudodiphtheriticum 090104]|nr:hypothetical protein N579_10465 [Corynebacterium pseudodiphtheriticum 090104]